MKSGWQWFSQVAVEVVQCNNSSPIHLKKFPVYASSLSDYSTEVKDFMTSLTFLPSLPPLLRAIRSSLLCSFMNIKDHRFASFFLHSCRFLGPTSTEMAGICYSIMGFHSLLYSSLYSEEKKNEWHSQHWRFIHSFTIRLLPGGDCYRWLWGGKGKHLLKPTEVDRVGNERWLSKECTRTLRGKTQDTTPDVTKGVLRNHWECIWKIQDFSLSPFPILPIPDWEKVTRTPDIYY